jgi:hypothetical protein
MLFISVSMLSYIITDVLGYCHLVIGCFAKYTSVFIRALTSYLLKLNTTDTIVLTCVACTYVIYMLWVRLLGIQ